MSLALYAQDVVSFLSVLTIIGQGIAALVLLAAFSPLLPGIRAFVQRHILLLLLIAPLTGLLGSLYFSELAGWTPCRLCWFQRIFLYPQVFVLLLALWRRDKSVIPYMFLLSSIGIVISAVHYGEQVNALLHPAESLMPCDDTGVSCASTPFFHFGYITIPMMAMTAFLLNIAGSVVALRRRS